MKQSVLLTITSLLTILFLTFHISDEIARGLENGGLNMLIPLIVLAVLLYGTLVLAGHRSGYIIMLLLAILGIGVPVVHLTGLSLIGGKIAADSSGSFFWVWQNITLCTISIFSLILAVRCLWKPEWAESR